MLEFIYLLAAIGSTGYDGDPERASPPPVSPIVPTPPQPPRYIAPPLAPKAQRPNPIPKGNPGLWASTNDYPSAALQNQLEGTTGFRVTVGPDGRVSDCQIMSSSGSSDLDLATCSNVGRRARFDPALDSRGEPTSGTYSNRVRWQIPQFATFVSFPRGPVSLKPGWTRVLPEDFPPEALTEKRQGTAKIEIGVSPTGTVSDCKLLQSSGHSDIDDASCKIATQRAMFGPALDVTGQTTAGRVQTDLNWRLPIDGSQAVGLPIDGAQDARPRPTLDFLPKAGTSELTFIVGKDGTLSDCNAQQSEGMAKGDPAMLCKIGVKQKPYTDADGQPVARRVRVKTSVVLDEVQ